MAASRARVLGTRLAPLAAAGILGVSVYAYNQPLKLDDTPFELALDESHDKSKNGNGKKQLAPIGAAAPFTPIAWGSNAHLTLVPDEDARGPLKRPTPMTHLGGTPLRDLVVHEKYAAAIDARGDLWMWGAGYDPSGEVGRSLRGKVSRSAGQGVGGGDAG